jgi:hypothetical protein
LLPPDVEVMKKTGIESFVALIVLMSLLNKRGDKSGNRGQGDAVQIAAG